MATIDLVQGGSSHKWLIGKIAKLTERGVVLEEEYEKLFGIGNADRARRIYEFCSQGGRYEMSLMFIDEPSEIRNGVTWFCLKEIGVGVMGDWHWYTLNQLMICD